MRCLWCGSCSFHFHECMLFSLCVSINNQSKSLLYTSLNSRNMHINRIKKITGVKIKWQFWFETIFLTSHITSFFAFIFHLWQLLLNIIVLDWLQLYPTTSYHIVISISTSISLSLNSPQYQIIEYRKLRYSSFSTERLSTANSL